jgi:TolA-binding protein
VRAALGRALATLALACALAACGDSADQLLETAAFEEVQRNHEHARKLYREVIERYPGTPQAKTAEEKLRALDAVPR